jgi:hypothetical protein
MDEREWLAGRFEEHRTALRAVAYRMLGSLSEADDAVQEAWLRLNRTDASEIENLGAWLRTVVARVSLNMLRSRGTRGEEPIGVHVPEPIVDRSPEAARQLASRARRRIRGTAPDPDIGAQREVVDAFFAAARDGDFDALVAVLDPDVVLRADLGAAGGAREVRGASVVAGQALTYSRLGLLIQPALVNGVAGAVTTRDGEPFSVGGFTVRDGRIVTIDILADPERLRRLDLTILER